MQALFLLSPSFFFSRAVRPQIHHGREGTIPQKLAVNSDPAADEDPELSLGITLPRYQNAAIITQLQMKEKNKPAVWSDGRACRLERSLCHTYQLRDISRQKTPGLDAYLRIPAPVQTCKYPEKASAIYQQGCWRMFSILVDGPQYHVTFWSTILWNPACS